MGIFTSSAFTTDITNIYSPAEQELACEGVNINFYEASMVAIAECEGIYNKAMKEIGIGELRYMEENAREIVYEAVDVKAVFNKIKMFFKKLIDKVKAIFHAFIAKISSWAQSDKDFVKKYQNEFSKKWNEVKEDFEFKGYKFTINSISENSFEASSNTFSTDIRNIINANGDFDDTKTTEDYNSALISIKEHKDDICDELRSEIVKTFNANVSDKLDTKEFSEELFKAFRGGESSKQKIEKKDTPGVAGIIGQLMNAKTTKTTAEKTIKAVIKIIEDNIKSFDKIESKLSKSTMPTDEEKINSRSAMLSLCTEYSSLMKCHKEYVVTATGMYLQALTDESRQNKAIMVKVIGGGKKMMKESYDMGSNYTGSFLDGVVLK